MIAVPQAAVDLAKRFEGFHRVPQSDPGRAHPYICPAGFWTIGYGHLCDAAHPPITEAEADGYLVNDLIAALNATLRCCPVLATEPEGRLAAIVDFTFNLGSARMTEVGRPRRPGCGGSCPGSTRVERCRGNRHLTIVVRSRRRRIAGPRTRLRRLPRNSECEADCPGAAS